MDVPPDIRLKQEVPVPAALVWGPPLPRPERFISPKEISDPVQSLPAPPRLNLNQEIKLAELNMPDIALTSMPALPVLPSASAPVPISGPQQGNQLPQSTLSDSEAVAAGNVISLPQNPLRAQNLVVVPPANQIAVADFDAALSHSGLGSQSAGDAQPHVASAEQGDLTGHPQAQTVPNDATSLTRITLPKDGKFGVVVMGSQASDLYPDSAGLLNGKVVYTVYLHVGLHKNWILEYCLPQASQLDVTAVDAPWPFLILRPDRLNILDLDYVIVRGDINSNGRFERLALVYPSDLAEEEHLLGALRQWSFRPARRDGEAIAVEAVLIIPRQGE